MFSMDIWLTLILAGLAWAAFWSLGRLALQAVRASSARRGSK